MHCQSTVQEVEQSTVILKRILKSHPEPFALNLVTIYIYIHCRSGNIREVSIFANFARSTNSQIQDSRENYYYSSGTKEK